MSKRFGLVLAALLVIPLLLTACDTSSRDAGEKYVEAVIKGDEAEAAKYACESFTDQTQTLLAYYKNQAVIADSLDLKYDIGKAGNTSEVIVTGAYKYGDPEMPREQELTEKLKTRIILDMEKKGDEWCVSDGSVFEGVDFGAETPADAAAPAEGEATPAPTEEATPTPSAG
jgi:predicted small secreted protein